MTVLRIVPNLAAADPGAAKAFYVDLLGLDPVMDMGWIVTFAAAPGEDGEAPSMRPMLSVASEGGGGAPVPDISVEVDDVDAVHARAQALGHAIARPLTDEPWGVRRFFLRDPAGRLVNVLQHLRKARAFR